jgi:hypothetical protein
MAVARRGSYVPLNKGVQKQLANARNTVLNASTLLKLTVVPEVYPCSIKGTLGITGLGYKSSVLYDQPRSV